MKLKTLIVLTFLFNTQFVTAEEDVVEIDGSTIIGNRELPKVMYIVPWKKSQLPDMESLPIDRLVNDALTPIDRKEFKQQVNFHEQLNPVTEDN